ncbi:hypothetical protein NDU88_005414 [Pleurodeles waltl]|uniref:Uncharacterized protein n=1 Tax=Pleurodeles waltl TaxID=8319 RepID=A0AAV7TVF8_PLEWA|nr:hypothetical protein NDU88_005414 [Pleurodeles waltl]
MSPTCQRLAYGFTRSQRDYVLRTFGIYRQDNSEESTGTGVLLPLRSSALPFLVEFRLVRKTFGTERSPNAPRAKPVRESREPAYYNVLLSKTD